MILATRENTADGVEHPDLSRIWLPFFQALLFRHVSVLKKIVKIDADLKKTGIQPVGAFIIIGRSAHEIRRFGACAEEAIRAMSLLGGFRRRIASRNVPAGRLQAIIAPQRGT